MTLGFLVIKGPDRRRLQYLKTQAERQDNLRPAFERPDLVVMTTPATPVVDLANHAGLVVGHAFSSEAPYLPLDREKDAPRPDARWLTRHIWGAYVGIWWSADGGFHLLRDPIGTLPVYYRRDGETLIAASHVDIVRRLEGPALAIDWQGLHRHLFARDLKAERTALAGISELRPGFVLSWPSTTVSEAWSPWDFVDRSMALSAETRAEYLRQRILNCTAAWARPFSTVLAAVSGGLDSSIMAAALKVGGANWRAYTLATPRPDGDERAYARILARHLNVPLAEDLYSLSAIDIGRAASRDLPRPMGHPYGQARRASAQQFLSQFGGEVEFKGTGGDNVFCFTYSATPVVDRFRTEGLSSGVWDTLSDVADLTGATQFQVTRAAWRRHHQPTPYVWHGGHRFLTDNRLNIEPELTHPWLVTPKGALPGHALHISMLIRVQATLEGFSRYGGHPTIYPLMSQPVVEFCLSTPSWMWCRGGQNRALARAAFVPYLPQQILDRTSKAGPDSFCLDVVQANLAAIRPLLLDGVLVENGLLDRSRLDAALQIEHLNTSSDFVPLSLLVEAENWVRAWLA
ncbi:asparagine synthetase B family protein [Asticcacaulis sp. YBE204]|uniref:asparagine synthase-related protein n=1 Tax=Asticcacaulis sp. YBE204 TaxID=1282363 RepID=UPI0003C3FCDB|nr:asparagine synthetase B family protein [Asticcacaulis sp. YBE204]ESQ79307.1 hypothetical protein AEYBE204_09870 [Asticcacaulis sp. YBE204]